MKTAIDKNETELKKMKREALEWLEKHPAAPPFINVAVNAFQPIEQPQPEEMAKEILKNKCKEFNIKFNKLFVRFPQAMIEAMEEYAAQTERESCKKCAMANWPTKEKQFKSQSFQLSDGEIEKEAESHALFIGFDKEFNINVAKLVSFIAGAKWYRDMMDNHCKIEK